MSRLRTLLVAILLLAPWFAPAVALAADDRVVPFANLMDGATIAELQGESDQVSFTAVVPPTAPLQQVVLTLSYENGIDLLPERSRLLLSINGQPVAELPLSAYRGPVSASITLPAERIRPGENVISLYQEAQHRATCNVRGTYDLWTRIDLTKSALTLRTGGGAPAPDLAMLPQLMAASDRAMEPLTVMRVGSGLRPDHLGWGAMIAQAYGLALHDQPPRVAAVALPGAGDGAPPLTLPGPAMPSAKAVLVGSRDELAAVLAPQIVQQIAGPFLGVYPSGSVPGGFLVVASGRSPAEVDTAVLRLADVAHPLPPQAATLIDALPLPVVARPAGVIHAGRYKLSDLGIPTTTHTGYRFTGRVTLRLPTDYKPVADRTMTLRINAAFEGELGRGAVLNVRVNKRMAGAIEVDRRSSGDIRKAEMRLPMHLFRTGANQIEFTAELPPAQETDCLFAVRKPKFTLYDTTELEVPTFARLVALPDLGTMGRTGFPFVRPDAPQGGVPFDLVLAGSTDAWHGVALTLMARLAQSADALLRPVPSIGWTTPGDRDALIVGPVAGLPQAALSGTTLAPDRLASMLEAGTRMSQAAASGEPLPAAERRRMIERLRSVRPGGTDPPPLAGAPMARAPVDLQSTASRWERLAQPTAAPGADNGAVPRLVSRVLELVSWTSGASVAAATTDALPPFSDDQLPDTALLQFEGPGNAHTTWTVLTGTDPRIAEKATERLVGGTLWNELDGGAGLWRSEGGTMGAVRPTGHYTIISDPYDVRNIFLIIASNLSQRIDLLFGLLLGAVVVLAIVTHMLLRLGNPRE